METTLCGQAMITKVYTSMRAGEEIVKYARDKNEFTGEERLLSPHELEDPQGVEVGDEYAYKVSLLSDRVFADKNYRSYED